MKTKPAAKSSKVTKNEARKSQAVEASKKPSNKTPVAKSKSNAKKDISSTVASCDKNAIASDSPQLYKNVHNIGRRRATERVVSYKETEIATCFKDSYWPDTTLDLGGPSHNESSQARTTQEKSSSMSRLVNENSTKTEDGSIAKQKPDKSPVARSELKSAKTVVSESSALVEDSASASGKRSSGVGGQKTGGRKTPCARKSPISRHGVCVSDVKKSNDDDVEALLSAAVSTNGDDSRDSDQQPVPKRCLQLSSKKRAELSFLARGVSATGCSDIFSHRPKGSDQPQYVRAKRTASLNAGAIMSLMLQKEEPSISKRDKLQWDDSDDDSFDGSSSVSSDSVDSTFSEYSASCASRLIKRPTKVLTSMSGVLASVTTSAPSKATSPKEPTSSLRDKEKDVLPREKLILPAKSTLKETTASLDEVAGLAKDFTEQEKTSSPITMAGSTQWSMNFPKGSIMLPEVVLGAQVMKTSLEAKPASAEAATTNASPRSPKNLGIDVNEGKGKRKRKEFEDYVPVLAPGKRMASLNAQAILVASRDERIKRSRMSGKGTSRSTESQTKASSLTERNSESSVENPFSKVCEKSPPVTRKTAQRGVVTSGPRADSGSGNTKNILSTSACSGTPSTGSYSLSTMPSNTGDVGVQYAGSYVGMVSPPSSVQLVEMTSTPVLTPNKTYQQLDRPQNCQQYSSDRHMVPAWAGNPYGVAQFHEMQSNSSHPADYHKSSSDRPLEKAQSNIVTALIPHATSLAPAVPLRFTAHIVPQNPLPQQGFYGQLQPHPTYFSERYPYAGPNLFSYQAKPFGSNTSFGTPHIPSDLYNASRQLQVYEVQAARPVCGRQSDFNLQLCPPQFIAPLTGPAENRDQLYRPYLSPPGHQSFQHPQHPTMCTSYMAPQIQVALAVPTVSHPQSEKQLGPPRADTHSVTSEQKLLKSSPPESHPNLTDISYSVVKRSGSQRRKQVETKHSSTQVKCHEVASELSSGGQHGGKRSPDYPKPIGTKPHRIDAKHEKCEVVTSGTEVTGRGGAWARKVAPPAHCPLYAVGSKPGDVLDDLHYTDLRKYSSVTPKPSPVGTPLQKEYLAKKEDSKPITIEISDTKPHLDSRELSTGVLFAKPDIRGVSTDSSSPVKGMPRKLMLPLETPSGAWPREASAEIHRLGAFGIHTSIIDLSQEKELDLSKKPRVSEAQESPGKRSQSFQRMERCGEKRKISEAQESHGEAAAPLKKKILKNRKTATELVENTTKSMDSLDNKKNTVGQAEYNTTGQDSLKLVPVSLSSSDIKSTIAESQTDPVSSCLSQLERFVSHHPGRKHSHDVLQVNEIRSNKEMEELTKSTVEITALAEESQNLAALKGKSNRNDDTVTGNSHLEDRAIVGELVASGAKKLGESSHCIIERQEEHFDTDVVVPVVGTSKPTLEASMIVGQSQATTTEESSDVVIDLTKSTKLYEDRLLIDSTETTSENCLVNKDEEIVEVANSEDAISKAEPVCCKAEISETKPSTGNDENFKEKCTDSDDMKPVTHDCVNFEAKPAMSSDENSKENCVNRDISDFEAKPRIVKLATYDDEAKLATSNASSEGNPATSDDTNSKVKFSASIDATVEETPVISSDRSSEFQCLSSSVTSSEAELTNCDDTKLKAKSAIVGDAVVHDKLVTSNNASSMAEFANSEDKNDKVGTSKSGNTKSLKKYQARGSSRQGFVTPLKEAGRSKELARKRVSSISFGRRSSSKVRLVRKCNDRKLQASVAASKICEKRKLNVDVMPKLGARRSQKQVAEIRAKVLTTVGAICKRKAGLEKDKLGRRLNEETASQQTNDPKCWKWREPGTMKLTYTEVESPPVQKMCYPAIEHTNGDVIRVRDCVFVRSGMRKKDIPYIAKIYAFWEHQETGEMMMGVFWYYRQHHSDNEHISKYLSNEVFASRHRDVIPVACIEDRCYVLTFNEFCRYKAEQKRQDGNLLPHEQKVPTFSEPYSRAMFQPPANVDPEVVFLCRNIYDIKLRRILRLSRKLQT